MDLKDFISDALCSPPDLIAYNVSRQLQQLYADRTIIEGAISSFDLASYVRAEAQAWLQGEACRVSAGRWEVRSLKPLKRS